MLRNRSRAVTSKQKQPTMADHISPSQNHTRPPISSFFGYPRFFSGFLGNGHSETETTMSPTSILDCKKPPAFANPFGYDRNLSKFSNTTFSEDKHSWESSSDPKGIGVALIDSHADETAHDDNISKPNKKWSCLDQSLRFKSLVFHPLLFLQLTPPNPLPISESRPRIHNFLVLRLANV
ncbi:FCS-Like Zinc finger 8-like [Cornus florida]|uniref:FCS-Like Zinc finger 8-like n=1 Tax=Cornus florida TaxID=4283 RepID=UPI00289F343E|nr:FCS-Like Zinc finger 8-like [Cornus florida]